LDEDRSDSRRRARAARGIGHWRFSDARPPPTVAAAWLASPPPAGGAAPGRTIGTWTAAGERRGSRPSAPESAMSASRLALALLLCTACSAQAAAPPVLEVAWTATGLANPESVAPSADGSTLYVSNVAGEADARDGVGFIARLSAEGELLEREWISGLNAPKGLLRRDATLFVSDIDTLVEIDLAQGEVIARHAVPGAKFLNDVALAPDGRVLVSDSAGAKIYAWNGSVAEEWLAHEELRSVNGLLPEAGRLVVSTMQGKLLAVDWKTRAVEVLATGLGNGDGVTRLADGSYLVSEWPGQLFHVSWPDAGAEAKVATLLDGREKKIFLNDFLQHDGLLLVPNWEPSTLTAYRLR
jgi:hypothetical protein